jgi:acyl-coenzyme A synthetase/AMP-(fatty) acid ligase
MLLQGMPHVVLEIWDAATAARLINEHDVTATGGTPFFLTTLLDLADDVDLSSLREYGVGGASVPPSVMERAHQHGIMAFRAYGSSEHPSISGGSSDDALDKRAHTDGRLLDRVEVRIVDQTLQDLPRAAQARSSAAARNRTVAQRHSCARLHCRDHEATDTRTPRARQRPASHSHRQSAQGRTTETLQRPASASADGPTS